MSELLARARELRAESVLERVFPLVAFDWDGTAVPTRTADASALGAAMDRLLRAGARLAVLTGTRFSNVDGALAGCIRGPHIARLLVSANRGSELYGYDPSGEPVLLQRRVATAAEESALDSIADGLAAEVSGATGLDVDVVRDRLNRRKIDLFPSWSDPPKERIAELVENSPEVRSDGGKGLHLLRATHGLDRPHDHPERDGHPVRGGPHPPPRR
ncbi:MAG: HAD family hydrolase, partial [Myxococcota bacterium]